MIYFSLYCSVNIYCSILIIYLKLFKLIPCASLQILWALQDLNRKWLLLQKRKNALQLYYNKRFEEESRRVYDETRLNLNKQLFESVMRSLKEAESEREVDDVDSKFNLHFPPGEAGVDEGQYKRPKRKSMYSTFSKAGLWEVASRFGCSSEQLGLCLSVVQLVSMLELRTALYFNHKLKVLFCLPSSTARVGRPKGNTRRGGF
jgi:hypothetical protein